MYKIQLVVKSQNFELKMSREAKLGKKIYFTDHFLIYKIYSMLMYIKKKYYFCGKNKTMKHYRVQKKHVAH